MNVIYSNPSMMKRSRFQQNARQQQHRFVPSHIAALENLFAKDPIPDRRSRQALAHKLGVSERQVCASQQADSVTSPWWMSSVRSYPYRRFRRGFRISVSVRKPGVSRHCFNLRAWRVPHRCMGMSQGPHLLKSGKATCTNRFILKGF
jgi:hypothetical protein